jgi:hypothetical protein
MTEATDLLERIGRSLFGKDWLRRTAQVLECNPATISKWRSGTIPSFSLRHPAFPRLLWYLRQQSTKLSSLAEEVDAITKRDLPNGKVTEGKRPRNMPLP